MLEQKKLLKQAFPFIILGLLAFVIYLLIFVDINEMLVTIKQADLPLFIFAFASSVIEMIFFRVSLAVLSCATCNGYNISKGVYVFVGK